MCDEAWSISGIDGAWLENCTHTHEYHNLSDVVNASSLMYLLIVGPDGIRRFEFGAKSHLGHF